jgi:hypothetical protein
MGSRFGEVSPCACPFISTPRDDLGFPPAAYVRFQEVEPAHLMAAVGVELPIAATAGWATGGRAGEGLSC